MGITYTAGGQACKLTTAPFLLDPFSALVFSINGGNVSGRGITFTSYDTNGNALSSFNLNQYIAGGSVPQNSWAKVIIPISALGITPGNRTTGFKLQENTGGAQSEFYIDQMYWRYATLPTGVTITANSTAPLRTVDLRHFGVNAAYWDSTFDTTAIKNRISQGGYRILRFPGGSTADIYHWQSNEVAGVVYPWAIDFDQFAATAMSAGAQSFVTTNYGSGTPTEAAAWVTYNKTKNYGFKYWEVGNEVYGNWENDTHARPHDPYTYGQQFALYANAMRAADSTIKVGAVATPWQNNYTNYTDHPALNPATGTTFNGWTPVMLTTMKAEGVYPDFLVYHRYPELSGGECDYWLLENQNTWATDIASLRQMLNQYLGTTIASKIEILCDESNTGGGGKQTVSLVNGLYMADSFGSALNTECNSFLWWDISSAQDTNGTMGDWLYGWRNYESLAQLDPNANPYPTFYVQQLLSKYTSPGDTVIASSTSNVLVSSYAVQRSDGSVALLLINKHPTATLPVQFSINASVNLSNATWWYYGESEDAAAGNNGSAAAQGIQEKTLSSLSSSSWFDLGPYSVNVIIFSKS